MTALLAHLATQVTATEATAVEVQQSAAIAMAYARTEQQNQALVDAGINAVTVQQKDPAPVLTAAFVAAIAALPGETHARALSQLQAAVNANRGLAARAGWSTLKKRIKDAAKKTEAARAGERNAKGVEDGQVVDANDPLALANLFADRNLVDGFCIIRRWKGRWYHWINGTYVELEDEVMDGRVYAFAASLSVRGSDGPAPLTTNKKLIENVLHALAPLLQVPGSSPIVWLDADQQTRPAIERSVFCANGTLDVDAWLDGRADAFITPTPALFILKTLATPFDPTAKAGRFERFVNEVFDGDVERIVALQLLFGYWLTPDTSLQIITIFSGPPAAGKGTMLNIIQGVIGSACTNPSFESLGDKFGMEDLVGGNLAILSDVHDVGSNVKSAVEKLLKISGEDPVDVNRKHRPALPNVRMQTRFLMAMNEAVPLPDVSGAVSRRLVLLTYRHSFIGQEHSGLAKEIIAEESPGVLLWALNGLRLLRHLLADAIAKGLPTKATIVAHLRTRDSEPEHERMDDLSNPVRVFIRELCHLAPGCSIDLDTLHRAWHEWTFKNNHQNRSQSRLAADLSAATKGAITMGQRTTATGERPRVLHGVTLHKLHHADMQDAAAINAIKNRAADAVPAAVSCLPVTVVPPPASVLPPPPPPPPGLPAAIPPPPPAPPAALSAEPRQPRSWAILDALLAGTDVVLP